MSRPLPLSLRSLLARWNRTREIINGESQLLRLIFPKDNTKEFDNDLTITDWLTQYSEIKDATYVRGFLGRMLFPGEDGVKRVRVLSGGEKSPLSSFQDDDLRSKYSHPG